MRDLNNFIDRCEVTDLNLLGRKFTWSNGQYGGRWSRIDRFMVHLEWLEHFKVKLWGLPTIISDHYPLLLMENERDWGPRPFRFINAWTMHLDFPPFLKKVWNETNVEGWAGFKLQVKLKSLKLALKQWNLEVFGNVNTKLKQAEVELHALDLEAEIRELDEDEKTRRAAVRGEIWKLSRMVDRIWLQKSRLNWFLNGDKNTRFFHIMASCRQDKNMISSFSENEEVVDDPLRVRQKVKLYFVKQFSESWKCRPTLGGDFKLVSHSPMFDGLEAEFTELEILSAIKECDGNKALGPDGFNLFFFQKSWKLMRGDVVQFMQDFHRNGCLVKGINSSFITLIPKKENSVDLEDFRPISLVGSLYEILTKVLTNRLKAVLPEIINEAQSAFLGGRNILDRVLIANEVVDCWKKSRKKGLIIKLDFQKAYDGVN